MRTRGTVQSGLVRQLGFQPPVANFDKVSNLSYLQLNARIVQPHNCRKCFSPPSHPTCTLELIMDSSSMISVGHFIEKESRRELISQFGEFLI